MTNVADKDIEVIEAPVLSADSVRKLLSYCLFKDNEIVDGQTTTEPVLVRRRKTWVTRQ